MESLLSIFMEFWLPLGCVSVLILNMKMVSLDCSGIRLAFDCLVLILAASAECGIKRWERMLLLSLGGHCV